MECRTPPAADECMDAPGLIYPEVHLPPLTPDEPRPSPEPRQPDWIDRVYGGLKGIADWLYPPACPLCGDPAPGHGALCAGCRADLPPAHPACPVCAVPVPEPVTCGECQRRRPAFTRTIAGAWFEPPIDHLLRAMKYQSRLDLVATLAGLLGDVVEADGRPLPNALVPVPLHVTRLRQRGLNPALEVARHLARRFAIPVDHCCAARIRPTGPQADLAHEQRRTNVRGAFACGAPVGHSHIAIIDDVMTTGSTAGELARCLRRAGAVHVDIWVLARTRLRGRG